MLCGEPPILVILRGKTGRSNGLMAAIVMPVLLTKDLSYAFPSPDAAPREILRLRNRQFSVF